MEYPCALRLQTKAAREMKERIAQITTAKDAQHLYMGTFHSIFARILRREGEAIGFGIISLFMTKTTLIAY